MEGVEWTKVKCTYSGDTLSKGTVWGGTSGSRRGNGD
jgi:hypothetical protein